MNTPRRIPMKQTFFAGLLAAAICLAAGPAKADYLSMDKFAYTNALMVSGYTGTETLENFPVLVRLAEYDESTGKGIPGFRYVDLTNNKGKDIAFFDELGNHLASEIQTNDWTTSGTSLIWVSLPRMQQGTKFYMCYNTTQSGAMVTNANPWTDYVGVWHLDETGGSGKTIYDSSTNGLNGTTYAGNVNSSGAVGKGRVIAADNNHSWGIVVNVLDDPVKKAVAESLDTDFHASFWMLSQASYVEQSDSKNNIKWGNILCRRNGDQGYSWGFQFGGDNTTGKTVDYMRVLSDNDNANNGANMNCTTHPLGSVLKQNDGIWKKVDLVWKYATNGNVPVVDVYTNGVFLESITANPAVRQEDANIGIGGSTQPEPNGNSGHKGRRFNGSMDEVRLRPGVLSAAKMSDWVKADYDTVNNEGFVVVAPPEVLEITWAGDAGRAGVTNVAWDSAVVGGVVTGFGENTTECAIEGKFWTGENEPSGWTVLTNGLGLLDAFEVAVPCQENTAYHYRLRAVDDADGETDPVSGTFTTPLGLAATWAEASGRAGVTNVLGHLVVVGGSVGALGGSATATVEGKFWENGQEEPASWSSLVGPLSQTGDFSVSVPGLSVDTLYSYRLRLAGSNGNATEPVSGTFTTGHGLTISWAGDASRPGVTNITWNAAVVGGIVEALGDLASCSIEGKFWVDGGSEPADWTALGAGGFGPGDFSATVPNLAEVTTYAYKLRATETDGSETPVASGTFTTPVGLAAAWADDVAGRPGVTAVSALSATVGGSVDCLGSSAGCTVEGKFWTGETEPENWTALGDALSQTGAFSATVPNLSAGTAYSYRLRLSGANGAATEPVSGAFTTAPGLTVAWSSAAGATGFSKVSYDFAVASGSVSALGDAAACAIEGKVWPAGGEEPAAWTTLAEGLGIDDAFNAAVPGLAAGTAYAYRLRAVGTDGEVTDAVSGSFTTAGEAGEAIGSKYTHFFDDGTNAYWVADDFERYLQFTVTGYEGTETLTNFPVLVEVRAKDTNGFSYDDFYHYDGADIAFVDEKGHIIPHEIDTWNKGGMSLFWVRLPEMVNGTTFTMCYRSPLVEPLPAAGNVFEKYVGVWHMAEPGNGVVALKDSTVNDFETETHAQSLETPISGGRIGRARRVAQSPGASSTYGRIIAFDHDDILRTGVGNVFTFSGWYKLDATPPKWGYLVARKSEDISRGWGVQYDEKDTTKLRVWSGSSEKNKHQMFNTPGAQATGWNYWTFVYDGSVNGDGTTNQLFHAFLNGVELASTVGGFALNYPVVNDGRADYDHLVIGGQENGTGAFNGLVDEARYSKGARSADWIKAEYVSTMQAQWWNDPARRFVTKADSVGRGDVSLVPVVVWEKGDGLPDTIVDVSYAYVQFAGTVTFCGANANSCDIEYQLWADGEEEPGEDEWSILLAGAEADTPFSIPITGLKQDMPYNFRIRAVNEVAGVRRQNRERSGSFRTTGNVSAAAEGELLRVGNKFVHRFTAGSWTFTTPDYVTNIEIMVVGGGGAGGYKVGGGGGGGGLFYSASYPVATSTVYRVQVGEGGIAASNLTARSGNGQYSYFARVDGPEEEDEVRLILVPGGGSGGSYVNDATYAAGADGASGGGGTYAQFGGTATDDGAYGHDGGRGNDYLQNGSIGKVAAGGGGGAGREGNGGTFDAWSAGGAGGVGVANSMTGETLFYGAGGGGGYIYRQNVAEGNFTKPGGGGSGIGGNAADVRNGTPATSGIENTGAGGGGGSSRATSDGKQPDGDSTYWQGGDGGDGVVLISYEVHGRDPISEDPCIAMTRCAYDPDAGSTGTGVATIDYRVFWAGIQAETNDVYVLYSTVGEEDIAAGNGEKIRIATGAIGIGTTTFVPPEVGHTYWIRLMARKDASSFMYSDEIASFTVPAVTLNGASWVGDTTAVDVSYKLHDKAPDSHLFCYWAESRALLEGDGQPTGDGVHFLDLGTGMSGATTFTIPATEGLDRANVYYFRLACGDDGGRRHPLSDEIVELTDAPSVILSAATWANQVATVDFTAKLTFLAPEDVQLFALYSLVKGDVQANNATARASVTSVGLGTFEVLPEGVVASDSFPLWSDVATNYYVRLGLYSASSNAWWYSTASAVKEVAVTPTIPNTLYIFANARAKKGAYGDAPQALDYTESYGGLTVGPGWENRPTVQGTLGCAVSSTVATGVYDITNEMLSLTNGGAPWHVDAVYDENTQELISPAIDYQYVLAYVGAPYTVTNAQFSVEISDTTVTYSGEPFDIDGITITESGVRNGQPVSYLYRVDSGAWTNLIDTTFSNIWTHIVQFKASATNHDDATGTFLITIDPAPLKAEISAANLVYTGESRTPAVTTNVSGLVRGDLNPLTCEFRDEAGEWQAEVPSFTQPGTYTLWFRASAPNHATAVTNCTFTVAGWEFLVEMDDGSNTTIRVTDPGWFIRNSPYTGDELADNGIRYAALNARCANGLKLWQNYVIEREVDDALVAAIHQACERVTENHFEIRFPNVSVLRNTGLDVAFRLDRKLAGEAAFSEGALSDKYEMNVPLGPSGLYVFNIVLSTTNDVPSRAVLASCATAGVLRVTSSATNLVAAVPWMSMASTNPQDEPVEVSETVNPNGISDGDRILAYNTASNFQGWAHLSNLGTDWGAIEAGSTNGVTVVTTNTTRFARGGAIWLVRTNPGDCFYLVGRYTGDEYTAELSGGSTAAPAYTLVANPTMYDVNLNDLVFVDGEGDPATPEAGDRIVVQDAAGFQKFYVRNAANTEWGRYVSGLSDGRVTQSWESGAAVAVPSGTGFWYVRTDGSPLAIRFGGAE